MILSNGRRLTLNYGCYLVADQWDMVDAIFETDLSRQVQT